MCDLRIFAFGLMQLFASSGQAQTPDFNADSAYLMIVPEVRGMINTNGGVAIGIFRGETDSTIVIGGHIDSSDREIPGANDDGSGTACVIELARVWSQRSRRFPLLFAAFGGEESGPVGSRYFVDPYAALDKVKLMLQIDMAGSTENLIPFLDVYTHQAPEWLVEDAYAFDRTLGYNSLDYKIDFISKPMLARSGRLVDAMLVKYQEQGIPAPKKGNYRLWHAFTGRLYLPTWLITVTNLLALVLGVMAFYWSRKNRMIIEKSQRIKFSGLKLFFIMCVIAIFMQLGEALMQVLKGLRYPWFVPLNHYLWFAALWAVAGSWLASQLTRQWRFSPDPYVYATRALIGLFVLTVVFGFATSRLAFYPALSLIALSLAIVLPNVALKIIVTILAPLPMIRLMFFEMFPLGARSLAESGEGINNLLEAFLYSGFLIIVIIIWYLPLLYLFAYTFASSWPKLSGLKLFRHPIVGFVILLAIAGYGGYLFSF